MKACKGFSIVEMAMVLVIIGIIIGITIKASDSIRLAKLRGELSRIVNITTALQGYRMAYGRLPGDNVVANRGNISKEDGASARKALVDAGFLSAQDLIVNNMEGKPAFMWSMVSCRAPGVSGVYQIYAPGSTGNFGVCVFLLYDSNGTKVDQNLETPGVILRYIGGYEVLFDDSNVTTGSGRMSSHSSRDTPEKLQAWMWSRTEGPSVAEAYYMQVF